MAPNGNLKDLRTGRLSNQEKANIKDWLKSKSVEEIAAELNRRVDAVQAFVDSTKNEPKRHKMDIVHNEFALQSRHFWDSLKSSFSDDELKIFEADWYRVIEQFGGDVLHTEETQIKNYCTISILMSRELQNQKMARDNIENLKRLYEKALDDNDNDMAESFMRRIDGFNAAIVSYTDKYKDLFDRQQKILSSMKSSRDQRVQELKTTTFFDWLKTINQQDKLERESREIEKHKLAMEKEMTRLGGYHVYEDGKIDQPLLNAETVLLQEE